MRYVRQSRWRCPEQSTPLLEFNYYFVEVSVNIDINYGFEGFHNNYQVKLVAYIM